MLGQMLFNGDRLPPQRARGLMWLTLARDNAAPDEAWIKESYTGRSRKRPRTTAPWRCRCSSTGCRAARTDSRLVPGLPALRWLAQAGSRSISAQTGTWSDGFSQART